MRRRLAALGLALCILAVTAAAALAAAGDLDPTFGIPVGDEDDLDGAGRVSIHPTATPTLTEEIEDIAIQPDGKIVAVGYTSPAGEDFALARFHSDGNVDMSFDGDGWRTHNFTGDARAYGVAIQPDGKIVTAGHDGSLQFITTRHNPNGSLDNGFDGDGIRPDSLSSESAAFDVALQPDGKIVVVGATGDFFTDNFAVIRYTANGTPDNSFSGNGEATNDFGGLDGAFGVAVQADGKIVTAGAGAQDFAVARFTASGDLDTAGFGAGTGEARVDFGAGTHEARDVAIQPDGKIVLVGRTGSGRMGVARLQTNGLPDDSFSGDGKQVLNLGGGSEAANAVALQPDGKIVVAGSTDAAGHDDFAIARLNPNGSVDTSFGAGGTVRTNFVASGDDIANAVEIQGDGKILAGGIGGFVNNFALARYLPDDPDGGGGSGGGGGGGSDDSDDKSDEDKSGDSSPKSDGKKASTLDVRAPRPQRAGAAVLVRVLSSKAAQAVARGQVIAVRKTRRRRIVKRVGLLPARRRLLPGRRVPMRLKPRNRRVERKIRRFARRGFRTRARIAVVAVDPAGNRARKVIFFRLRR